MYEYRCRKCGHRFEKIQSFSAEPETVCPVCEGELYRPLTAPAFNFKGAGWYVNDYAPKSSSASATESAAPTAPPCATTGTCPATGCAPATASAAATTAVND